MIWEQPLHKRGKKKKEESGEARQERIDAERALDIDNLFSQPYGFLDLDDSFNGVVAPTSGDPFAFAASAAAAPTAPTGDLPLEDAGPPDDVFAALYGEPLVGSVGLGRSSLEAAAAMDVRLSPEERKRQAKEKRHHRPGQLPSSPRPTETQRGLVLFALAPLPLVER